MRNLELPGRSPVYATQGMACTSHPLSSQAAIDILKAGGNALDAAVTACAVQCAVEPESMGIGGDCFCLYAPAGAGVPIAYNGSGRAPAAATPEWFRQQGIRALERQMPHSVTVPGAVEAWHHLVEDYGTHSFGSLLQHAIRYAREGYPIAPRVHFDFSNQVALLRSDEDAARVFLPDGKVPKLGKLHRQPELAATLEKIAEEGPDGFYRGEVAADIVEKLQSKGGLHTLEDFAAAQGEYVTPVSTDFRGYRVFECPPNGQGIIALLLLNIMSGIEVEGRTPITADRLHLEIEACKQVYAQRNLYVADPAMADVDIDRLLSEELADELRRSISPALMAPAAAGFDMPAHQDTVYITVVDKDRNACSFINSLFSNFGSGIMAPRSGVMLHNRGQSFDLDPEHPNCIAPGKRPMHTIIPGMVAKDGRIAMPFGIMGGHYQSFGHMQFLTRFFDYGCDIQEAMDLPRVFPDPWTGDVAVESGVPGDVVEDLRARGHAIAPPDKPIGGSQAIWIDWEENVLTGGSDPRKDGAAVGY